MPASDELRDDLHMTGHREDVPDAERRCDPLRSPAFKRPKEPVTCGDAVLEACGRQRPGESDCERKRAQTEPSHRRSQTSAASAASCPDKRTVRLLPPGVTVAEAPGRMTRNAHARSPLADRRVAAQTKVQCHVGHAI